MSSPKKIRIGTFGRPHGVKGELRLWLDNPTSDTLYPGIILFTSKLQLELVSIRYSKKFAVVRLVSTDSREDAQALTNLKVSILRDDFPEIEDDGDTFYQIDLLGLPVIDTLGEKLGEVENFLDGLSTEVAEIRTAKGTFLLPWLGHIIRTIDLEKGIIIEPLSEWMAEDD